MSRIILALIAVVLVASCGQRSGSAPRDLDNACAILTERSHYVRAFRNAKRTWGVEPAVLMAMIYQESKFIATNRTPHQYVLGVIPVGRQSSAYGYPQALDGTWREYQEDRGGMGARRHNINDAVDFMGWYMSQSSEVIGISINDTRNQYLAYHEGRTGYLRGTYRSKTWLVNIASQVADRAVMYQRQLQNCRAARF